MDKNEITETLERLDRDLIPGRPVAMGPALYAAILAKGGLVSFDTAAPHGNPNYRGLAPILLPGLSDWEFQIGPPRA